jgi:hypothetical protein
MYNILYGHPIQNIYYFRAKMVNGITLDYMTLKLKKLLGSLIQLGMIRNLSLRGAGNLSAGFMLRVQEPIFNLRKEAEKFIKSKLAMESIRFRKLLTMKLF